MALQYRDDIRDTIKHNAFDLLGMSLLTELTLLRTEKIIQADKIIVLNYNCTCKFI